MHRDLFFLQFKRISYKQNELNAVKGNERFLQKQIIIRGDFLLSTLNEKKKNGFVKGIYRERNKINATEIILLNSRAPVKRLVY